MSQLGSRKCAKKPGFWAKGTQSEPSTHNKSTTKQTARTPTSAASTKQHRAACDPPLQAPRSSTQCSSDSERVSDLTGSSTTESQIQENNCRTSYNTRYRTRTSSSNTVTTPGQAQNHSQDHQQEKRLTDTSLQVIGATDMTFSISDTNINGEEEGWREFSPSHCKESRNEKTLKIENHLKSHSSNTGRFIYYTSKYQSI